MNKQDSEKKPLEDIYKGSFFSRRYKLDWRAEHVCSAVVNTFNLSYGETIVDVGCAIGEYVRYFRNHYGLSAEGIEGSSTAMPHFVTDSISILDLRKPLGDIFRFKVCMSLEVAEHIEPEYAEQYVENLAALSDNILVTAAPPGQGGHHHVNCQPQSYWEAKFFKRNYMRSHLKEDMFKGCLSHVAYRKEIRAYVSNCMIFRKV